VDKYHSISPTGSSTGTPINLERRFALMQSHVDLADKHILDMGCGDGRYVSMFLEYSPHVRGIDFNEDNVQAYRQDAHQPDRVSQGDIQELPFGSQQFDVVLLNEVLEHVPDDRKAIAEAWRVLKPGGQLIVFSPTRLYPFETHGVHVKKSGRLLPHWTPFIPWIPISLGQRFFSYPARNYFPWDLKRLLKTKEFHITGQTAIWQTFENISGSSPALIVRLSGILRSISFMLEKIPLIRSFGVSQVIFAQKSTVP
jgi:ubiquinone/menaquinone biosynthesis C-methylase UbiE